MTRWQWLLAICMSGWLATTAHAQADDPPPPPPPSPPGDPGPAASAVAGAAPAGVLEDANSGRTWASPTALMAPAGSWTFNDYELFLVGGSYALSDSFQLALSTLVPITSDQPLFLILTGKARILAAGALHIAAHGTVVYVGDDAESFTIGTVGGVITHCLDADCHSHFNGYAAAGFSKESDTSAVPFVLSGAFVGRVNRRIKLVFEADSGFVLGEINEAANGFLGWYGLRFTSRHIGVDVGLVRPFGEGVDMEVFPLGFPWLNFTYREL
jgi:hypothetical protein